MNSNLFAKGLNHKLNTERRENLKTAQFENDKFKNHFNKTVLAGLVKNPLKK